MKITMNVECTPEEARAFIGLPDLGPIHASYVEKLRTAIEQGITPDAVRTMMQTWGPMGEAGFSLWRQMLDQIGGPTSRS